MRLLSRILAAVAASGIWLFIPGSTSARPASYPVWPSFLSTGCNAIQGPTGSTTISCGQGAFLLSQINSGYACNQVDISITSFGSGPFTVTGTVNSGSQSNTLSINGTGNYYMTFPGFLVNNLVTIQISAPDSGSMTIGSISSSACPVATSTDTPNPSFTATNTPVPVTGTPTPIPTNTPFPSGHSTFTPAPTQTGTPPVSTHTPTVTPTIDPTSSWFNCGEPSFPMLDCTARSWTDANHNTTSGPWAGSAASCFGDTAPSIQTFAVQFPVQAQCIQTVIAQTNGSLDMLIAMNEFSGQGSFNMNGVSYGPFNTTFGLQQFTFGTAVAGLPYTFQILEQNSIGAQHEWLLQDAWVQPTGGTPGTGTPTLSPTVTSTPTPVPGTSTDTPVPTDTPIPIPGAMSTNIPTSTECPGGCAVKALTAIPGLSTVTTVDTSPFSQLQHLSLARNGCTAFGYVQIPMPVIHGTPALGMTNPLSVTWTLPITHDWDNTHPYSNTAIEPCAMDEIPTSIWDFTYWLSVFGAATVWIMWMIGLVGRLSGDETING